MRYSFDALRSTGKGPLLFKSFTGLAVPEFDVIAKEIESKYEEHERKSLSDRKRESEVGLMLLVYYFRLYICIVRTSIRS